MAFNDALATVESNIETAPGYRLLTLHFKDAIPAAPGQFAMIRVHECPEPLLRRALAIYRVLDAQRISFLYQVLGRGTLAISRLIPGGEVDILIPLGNTWLDPESVPIPADTSRVIVVAGGIGSASILMVCEELVRRKINTQLFFGASSEIAAIGCGLKDLRATQVPMTITTDDGSLGEQGLVTSPLEQFLKNGGNKDSIILCCGPWVMMKRVSEIAEEYGVPCFVSLEAPMGCGFGVCVGCVVAVKDDGTPGYESYKRVCVDGSIFPSEIIRWDVKAMPH